MNKLKENKGVSLSAFVITILVILLIVAVLGCVYFYKGSQKDYKIIADNTENSKVDIVNEAKKNIENEKLVENNNTTKKKLIDNKVGYEEGSGAYFNLPYHVDADEKSIANGTNLKKYDGSYSYSGENKGKLIINGHEIITNKTIKMVKACNQDFGEYPDENGNYSYDIESKLYIIFEDGTLGYISSKNIKANNYEIKMLAQYKNMDYFIEMGPISSGVDTLLVGVDDFGNAYTIDWIYAGD